MGFILQKIVASLLLPPGILIISLGLGLWLGRRRAWARVLAYAAVAALWLLSTPWIATRLLRSVESVQPLMSASAIEADAIVVLGGGVRSHAPQFGGQTVSEYALERLHYAARLHRQSGLPILVTGGAPDNAVAEATLMAQVLREDFAVPVDWVESRALDTADNARLSADILMPLGKRRIVLVSHAWHVPRAIPVFEEQGFIVLPAPTGFTGEGEKLAFQLAPNGYALWQSYIACREGLGQLWYRLVHRR